MKLNSRSNRGGQTIHGHAELVRELTREEAETIGQLEAFSDFFEVSLSRSVLIVRVEGADHDRLLCSFRAHPLFTFPKPCDDAPPPPDYAAEHQRDRLRWLDSTERGVEGCGGLVPWEQRAANPSTRRASTKGRRRKTP